MTRLSRSRLSSLRPEFEVELKAKSTVMADPEEPTWWWLSAHYLADADADQDLIALAQPGSQWPEPRPDDEDPDVWRIPVLAMCGLSLSLLRPGMDFADILDAQSADYAAFMPLVDVNDLAPELYDLGFGLGRDLVIIDRAHLHPLWRGHGIGRLLIATAIDQHFSAASCVATLPCPVELLEEFHDNRDDPRFVAGQAAVERSWESIGFERLTDEVWAKNPAMAAGDDHVRELRTRILGR